jgi:hypothetical protein
MKYKAILLSILLLAPIMLVFAPHASASSTPVVWVNPSTVRFEAPCQVSKTFTVDVKLWNKMDLTQEDIYGFDFYIWWYNSTAGMPNGDGGIIGPSCPPFGVGSTAWQQSLISLVGVSFTSPWDHYFVVANESINYITVATNTKSVGQQFDGTHYYDGYHLAITALDNSPPLTDVQVVLLTLTFHIDSEPCFATPAYPTTVTNPLAAANAWVTPFIINGWVSLSDSSGSPVTPEMDDGQYIIYAGPPDVDLILNAGPDTATSASGVNPDDGNQYFMYDAVGVREHVEVWMSNMSRVYGFGFIVGFNYTDKKADIQSIKISDSWPAPYEYYYAYTWHTGDQGYLEVLMRRPSEKPPVTCAIDTMVASFDLITKYDSFSTQYVIPFKENSTVFLQYAYMLTKKYDGNTNLYDGGLWAGVSGQTTWPPTVTNMGGWYTAFNPLGLTVNGLTFGLVHSKVIIDDLFRPIMVPNEYPIPIGTMVGIDLNLDGTIDQQDLQALAMFYGLNLGTSVYGPTWGYLDNLPATGGSGVVDIYDFVLVASLYGKTWTMQVTN